MSNTELALQTQLDILGLTSIVGVITQVQLRSRNLVSRPRLFKHLEGLLSREYLTELPARSYYANSSGRPSPVYQLTPAGAKFLRDNGQETRPSGLRGQEAIDHALAMLDCRLVLNERLDLFRNAYTDRPIPYEQGSVIRPDNRVVPHGSAKSVLFESENLQPGSGSRGRIRAKVKNLTRFFLSAEGQNYDSLVRIVYVWSEARHAAALDEWTRACRAERLQRGVATLPFRLVFTPHKLFLDTTDPLSLEAFEPLPLGGTEPEPIARPYLDSAPPATSLPAEPDERPVQPSEREALLDEATLRLLCAFRESRARGIEAPEDLAALLRMLRSFLTARGSLAEDLGTPVKTLVQPHSYAAAAFALERVALTFFDHVGVPAVPAMRTPDYLADAPVTVQAVSERNTRPGLAVKINLSHARRLMLGWEGDTQSLSQTFEAVIELLVLRSRELDLTGSEEDK